MAIKQPLMIAGVWVLGVGCGLLGANGLVRFGEQRHAADMKPVVAGPVAPGPVDEIKPKVVPPVEKPVVAPPVTPSPPIFTPVAYAPFAYPADAPEQVRGNANSLVKQYRTSLVVTASSEESPNWCAAKVVDCDPKHSWFTRLEDTAAHGKKPWVKICFPEKVTIRRVTVLGNREPNWPKGFTVLAGRLELLDEQDKVLYSADGEQIGSMGDFDFAAPAVTGVRSVRFVSLGDQGDQNTYREVAIGEILID